MPPEQRDVIVAAELPRHRDHLAVALGISLVVALTGAFTIVMVPRPPNDIRYLEQARSIRTRALEERERRRTMKPLLVPVQRPSYGDQLMWTPGESIRASMPNAPTRKPAPTSCEHAPDDFEDDELIEAPPAIAREVFAPIELAPLPLVPLPATSLPSAFVEPHAAAEQARAHAPEFVCRAPDRDAVRMWFVEHVNPVLRDCMIERPPEEEVRGAVTLAFDEVGRVSSVDFTEMSEEFAWCAQPQLAELADPDWFELTFTWPFVLLP